MTISWLEADSQLILDAPFQLRLQNLCKSKVFTVIFFLSFTFNTIIVCFVLFLFLFLFFILFYQKPFWRVGTLLFSVHLTWLTHTTLAIVFPIRLSIFLARTHIFLAKTFPRINRVTTVGWAQIISGRVINLEVWKSEVRITSTKASSLLRG